MNYKHLYYFWMVAKQGSITKATDYLHVTPQTISGQISLLEEYYKVQLFNKVGRSLQLSDIGHQVYRYANEIFSTGNELEKLLQLQPSERIKIFNVGIVDVVPKTIAHQILLPAIQDQNNIRMNCREGNLEALLSELSLHKLDLVIAENPIPETISMKGVSKKLGQSTVSFFATHALAKQLQGEFPHNLNHAPLLLPNNRSQSYISLENWFSDLKLTPNIVAEFDDSALMKAFGSEGVGVFPAPSVIKTEIESQYDVIEIGRADALLEAFYGIYVEKRENTPIVNAICAEAGKSLFA